MKELWELLLRSVPTPLRVTLMIVSAFLVILVAAIKTIEEVGFRDVFMGSYFLTGAVLSAFVLAIQFFRNVQRPWSLILPSALVLLGAGAAFFAWKAWQISYDDRGFYMDKHWKEVRRSDSDLVMALNVTAALNTPSTLTMHVETLGKVCPDVTIRGLHPVIPPDLDLKGSETLEPREDVRQYSFEGFRRPAKITFYLTLSNVGSMAPPDKCFIGSINSDGAKAKEESSKGKEQ